MFPIRFHTRESTSTNPLFSLDGIKDSLAKLEACYAKAGVADRCRTRLYDSPHQFSVEMQTEAWAWLERFVLGRTPAENAPARE